MNKRQLIRLAAAGIVAVLAACGGGGGSSPGTTSVTVQLSTVSPAATPPRIKGVEITLELPAGVTIRTVRSTKQTAEGVIRYSGGAAFSNLTSQLTPHPLFGIYSAAGLPGHSTVTITFIGNSDFGPGEFATLYCDRIGGASVTASSFKPLSFRVIGDSATMLADDLTYLFDPPKVTLVQ